MRIAAWYPDCEARRGTYWRRTHEETEANPAEPQLGSTPTSLSSILHILPYSPSIEKPSCFYINLLASRSSNDSDEDTPTTILGKRKERSDDESNDCQINPLTPVKDYASLTDAVAMDCEMVGVGEGNKSALGRVTLVLILGVHVTDFGRSWISKHGGAVSLPKNETVPAVIVFGDSVVDPGNNNYINTIVKCNFPPYGREFGGGNQPTRRFSNGLVPSDIIASKFGVKKLMPAYLDPNLELQDLLT